MQPEKVNSRSSTDEIDSPNPFNNVKIRKLKSLGCTLTLNFLNIALSDGFAAAF